MKELKIVMPDERPMSANKIKGAHWAVSNKYKKACYLALRQALTMEEPQFTELVDIHITAYFDNKPQDGDNIHTKYYIDALRYYGIIADDEGRHVRWSASRAEVDAGDPWVEVLITVVD